jgi:Domain of unknown function (DUF2382)
MPGARGREAPLEGGACRRARAAGSAGAGAARVQLAPLDAVVLVIVAALEVPRRVVEAGTVRLTTMVHAREALVDAPLLHDNVTITRVPIQRVVDGPVPVRKDHGTRMLAVVEAVLVVEKQWRLRKEIHLRTQCIETHQPQRITLLSRRRRG